MGQKLFKKNGDIEGIFDLALGRRVKLGRHARFLGGYAFHMRGTRWRAASDEAWEIEVLGDGRVRVLGTRSIDGVRVVVFSVRGEKGRFAAKSSHFTRELA